MRRTIIAAATAVSMAIAGAAPTPALADKDGKKVLGLILGAAAVGLLLNEMNRNRAPAVARNPTADDWQIWPKSRPARLATIPGECLMDVTVDGRLRQVVSGRCAREFGVADNLPGECAFDIRTSVGARQVYGPSCLRDYGYRVASADY